MWIVKDYKDNVLIIFVVDFFVGVIGGSYGKLCKYLI